MARRVPPAGSESSGCGVSRRQLLAGGAALLHGAPAQAGSRSSPRLRLRRGMNLWPWFSLTRELPAPSREYGWPPYQPGRPVPRRADLEQLRVLGFDFVRIPVDPGPLLAFGGERRGTLVGDVVSAVSAVLRTGLSAVVDLHPNQATHHWRAETYATSLAAAETSGFVGLVRMLARALSALDAGRIALELLNEPPNSCGSVEWARLQLALVGEVRSISPDLSIVVTGACGSGPAGLEALDTKLLHDSNLIYTFHYYEPYMFTHQGAGWMTAEPMYRFLAEVPWPSSSGLLESAVAAFDRRIGSASDVSIEARAEIRAAAVEALHTYFDARPARWFVEKDFRRIAEWADARGIARHQVLLGEFGALRSRGGLIGAAGDHRARYIRDVRESAEKFGFGWTFWNYFTEMGFVLDDTTRRPDEAIVGALGLRS